MASVEFHEARRGFEKDCRRRRAMQAGGAASGQRRGRTTAAAAFVGAAVVSCGWAALAEDAPEAVDQHELNALNANDPAAAFIYAFEVGDELTEAVFTSDRGVGARVTDGKRFTRYPRADLDGPRDWASHEPAREGGPQAQSCIACHALPYANGAGSLATNVAIDPLQTGDPALYLARNTKHLFGLGAVQRISEEMTAELQKIEDSLGARVCAEGAPATAQLRAKGVDFGMLRAVPQDSGGRCVPHFDRRGIEGVDPDLVVRMFGWKGTHASIRAFTRGAAHNEMGMQADELVGAVDGDHDGVTGELSVGDVTAMTIYLAALERPTSKLELDDLGLIELDPAERIAIEAGMARFEEVGCASCHKPAMTIDDPVFSEPSRHPDFAEAVLPSGAPATVEGLADASAISFDLTADQPNNRVMSADGSESKLGAFPRDAEGRAVVRYYSDFRRHEMGDALADPVDAYGIGASVWPTKSLAGVGSTGPWLHHGHATTLEEAIGAHGGEALASRKRFEALEPQARRDIITFLENLVIVDLDPEEEEEEDPEQPIQRHRTES